MVEGTNFWKHQQVSRPGQIWFTRDLPAEPVQYNDCWVPDMRIWKDFWPSKAVQIQAVSLFSRWLLATHHDNVLGDDVRSFSKARLLCRFQVTYLSGLEACEDCETFQSLGLPAFTMTAFAGILCYILNPTNGRLWARWQILWDFVSLTMLLSHLQGSSLFLADFQCSPKITYFKMQL
jgi:hypothetical protein